jgi:hypothetical protein
MNQDQSQKSPAIVLTVSYSNSGVETDLSPVGILFGECWSEARPLCRMRAIEELAVKAGAAGTTHVFDVKFEEWVSGHPNNGNYRCIATGNGYRPT